MDAKCDATRGDARNPWTSADPRERLAPGWGLGGAPRSSCRTGGLRPRAVSLAAATVRTRRRGGAGSTRRARRTGTHIHRHPRRLPDQPVLISVHSTGRAAEVVDLIERHQHPGIILHWFLGTDDLRDRAHAAGAYLSVNQAMSDAILQAVPIDGLLPETDFPARQVGAHIPGAIAPLEKRLCGIWGRSAVEVRQQLWTNLKTIAIASGAIDVVSEELADRLVAF